MGFCFRVVFSRGNDNLLESQFKAHSVISPYQPQIDRRHAGRSRPTYQNKLVSECACNSRCTTTKYRHKYCVFCICCGHTKCLYSFIQILVTWVFLFGPVGCVFFVLYTTRGGGQLSLQKKRWLSDTLFRRQQKSRTASERFWNAVRSAFTSFPSQNRHLRSQVSQTPFNLPIIKNSSGS